MEKTLIIMRSLPFCGKSYTAKQLVRHFETQNPDQKGVIYSTDEFFYRYVKPEKPEEYSWNPRFLAQAHKWNQQRAFRSIETGEPLIIIDNTNVTAKAFCCSYVRYAHWQDYQICIQEPTSERWTVIRELLRDKRGNKQELKEWAKKLEEGSKETHSVPAYAIERMMWQWECDLMPEAVIANCEENHPVDYNS